MLIVVSPAKKLDFESPALTEQSSELEFKKETQHLVSQLKKLGLNDIKKMMKLSDTLSELNYQRFQNFSLAKKNTKQALYAFNGDTYQGLDAKSFKPKEVEYAQKHLRILSGLYGYLKPLDLIAPYRLEMGTKFQFDNYKNLYAWWDDKITNKVNEELKKEKFLINCASKEYFSSIKTKQIQGEIITPNFLEKKNGTYKQISFNAKRARGMFARFIIQNKITQPDQLKEFADADYKYNKKLSSNGEITFTRG